jgi:hypothetical protein
MVKPLHACGRKSGMQTSDAIAGASANCGRRQYGRSGPVAAAFETVLNSNFWFEQEGGCRAA